MKWVLTVLAVAVWAALISAWWTARHRAPVVGATPTQPRCLSPESYGGDLVAVASQDSRAIGGRLTGHIALNGTCYRFSTGGLATSAPFGRYVLGRGVRRPYLNALNDQHTAYPMSDAFDALLNRMRTALFVHPGEATRGCIGIDPWQWDKFERDMSRFVPAALVLTSQGRVKMSRNDR